MKIILNTDKNISGDERLEDYLSSLIEEELSHFSEHITRIEIHLADENGPKNGQNDKRCTLEARIEGRKPIAVTCHANSVEQSVNEAIEKLKAMLETIDGKVKS
ncbi:MAG: ribosome-associated translation inhibitor RaiA [Marinoscillum sp.]|jgi:ribosome-associated translation inhibitor RaiA